MEYGNFIGLMVVVILCNAFTSCENKKTQDQLKAIEVSINECKAIKK